MSANDTTNATATANPARRRFGYRVALFSLIGALLLLLGGGTLWWLHSGPEIPEVDVRDLDPAIAAAIEQARAEIRQTPHSAKAWGHLGTVLTVHDFRTQGEVSLLKAQTLDPEEPRWPYFQALSALAMADADAALPKLEQTVALCGSSPDAPRVRLAELHLSQNRLEEAEQQFRLLLQVNPSHPRAHLGLARVAFQRGEPRASLEPLAIAQRDERTRKQALEFLAQVQLRLGNPAAAEDARKKATDLPEDPHWHDPFNEEATNLQTGKAHWLRRVRRFSVLGREADARALLLQTLDAYPNAEDVWRSMGQMYLRLKDPEAAELAMRLACDLGPENYENFYYLGNTRIAQNDPAGAVASLRKAVALKADFAPAWYNLGNCLYHEKDARGAIDAYREAVRHDPNLFLAHLNLAGLLMEKNEDVEALVFARNAQALAPADARATKLVETLRKRLGK